MAKAVAEEMQKVYQNELGPQPVPLTVPAEQKVIDEEDVSLVFAFYIQVLFPLSRILQHDFFFCLRCTFLMRIMGMRMKMKIT